MPSEKKFGWIEFLTGFAAGGFVTILLTRKNLKNDIVNLQKKALEIKNQLIGKAKSISSDLTERSYKFIETSRKFAEGKYAGTIDSLENEYLSIRNAINSAIDSYRKSSKIITDHQIEKDELFIDFEDETLPKFAGMGRRKK